MKLDDLNTTVLLAAQLLNSQEANYLFFYFNSFQTHCWTSHTALPLTSLTSHLKRLSMFWVPHILG